MEEITEKPKVKAKCMTCEHEYDTENDECACKKTCPKCGKKGSSVYVINGQIIF